MLGQGSEIKIGGRRMRERGPLDSRTFQAKADIEELLLKHPLLLKLLLFLGGEVRAANTDPMGDDADVTLGLLKRIAGYVDGRSWGDC